MNSVKNGKIEGMGMIRIKENSWGFNSIICDYC